jgi:hypothetical protein
MIYLLVQFIVPQVEVWVWCWLAWVHACVSWLSNATIVCCVQLCCGNDQDKLAASSRAEIWDCLWGMQSEQKFGVIPVPMIVSKSS